jgi:Methyltransferase domain
MQNTSNRPPVDEHMKPRTSGEETLRLFARDMSGSSVNVGFGGSVACAFLRQAFPTGLPSGFGTAEVGVWRGDTSLQLAELLPADGFLHIFDYDVIVQSVKQRLAAAGHINVTAFGCTTKSRDSYNWSLMRLLICNRLPIYDYIYVDGSHTWDVDALAFCLLDRLLKPGGYIDFDDYHWTMASSPTQNPRVSPQNLDWFTEEQINTPHVMLIVELLVKRDPRYREVVANKIFRKIGA